MLACVRRSVLQGSVLRSFSSSASGKTGSSTRFTDLVQKHRETKRQQQKDQDKAMHFKQRNFADKIPATGIYIPDKVKNKLANLHFEDPETNTLRKLATQFQLSLARVEAIVALKRLELTKFGKLEDSDEAFLAREDLLAPEDVFVQPPKAHTDFAEPLEEVAELKKDDVLFSFLNDEEEQLENVYNPESVERLRRKIDPRRNETVAFVKKVQKNAPKKPEELPTFSAFADESSRPATRSKIAIKDLSDKNAPLMMRDETGTLRLATLEEASVRSWVQRDRAIDMIVPNSANEELVEPEATAEPAEEAEDKQTE